MGEVCETAQDLAAHVLKHGGRAVVLDAAFQPFIVRVTEAYDPPVVLAFTADTEQHPSVFMADLLRPVEDQPGAWLPQFPVSVLANR